MIYLALIGTGLMKKLKCYSRWWSPPPLKTLQLSQDLITVTKFPDTLIKTVIDSIILKIVLFTLLYNLFRLMWINYVIWNEINVCKTCSPASHVTLVVTWFAYTAMPAPSESVDHNFSFFFFGNSNSHLAVKIFSRIYNIQRFSFWTLFWQTWFQSTLLPYFSKKHLKE
jgi:hypothetical protein